MRQGGPSLKAAVWEAAVLRIWCSTVARKSTTVCAVMLTSKSDWLEKCDVSAPADALMHPKLVLRRECCFKFANIFESASGEAMSLLSAMEMQHLSLTLR
jgi:hypothetical protein